MGFFIPFAILFLICGLISRLLQTTHEDLQNLPITAGQIEQVHLSETGNIRYTIGFQVNGQYYQGLSIHYASTGRKYHPGDPVSVGYYFNKKGIPLLVVNDPDLIPNNMGSSISHKVFFILSGVCLALFVITLIIF